MRTRWLFTSADISGTRDPSRGAGRGSWSCLATPGSRLYQQRLVLLLTMAAFVWPLAVRRLRLSHQSCGAAAGARTGISRVHPGRRQVLRDLHVRPGGVRGLPRGAGRPRPSGAGPGEQRASSLFQPAAHALELRPGAADRARRHVVGRHVGSGPPSLRTASRPGRRLVVPGELDAGCRHGGRVPSLAARPEPRGDGQFRLREMAGRGRSGQPGVLLHPGRCVRDDRRDLPRDVGARPGSGLGGQPGVGHAAGRRSARRSGGRGIHVRAGRVHCSCSSS